MLRLRLSSCVTVSVLALLLLILLPSLRHHAPPAPILVCDSVCACPPPPPPPPVPESEHARPAPILVCDSVCACLPPPPPVPDDSSHPVAGLQPSRARRPLFVGGPLTLARLVLASIHRLASPRISRLAAASSPRSTARGARKKCEGPICSRLSCRYGSVHSYTRGAVAVNAGALPGDGVRWWLSEVFVRFSKVTVSLSSFQSMLSKVRSISLCSCVPLLFHNIQYSLCFEPSH